MHEEIIEEIKEKPSKLRKIVVVLVGLFLLVIILTYFLTSFVSRDVLVGLFRSSTVENYRIEMNSETDLVFLEGSYDQLLKLFEENKGREFKACLKGEIKGNYYVDEIFVPEMSFQSYGKVISEPCPKDSLISMHSQPLLHCMPSTQDMHSFKAFKEENEKGVMAIMCEDNRFNFYF